MDVGDVEEVEFVGKNGEKESFYFVFTNPFEDKEKENEVGSMEEMIVEKIGVLVGGEEVEDKF